MGKSVILVDGDLGGSNLNTALGSPEAKHTSVDFFIRRDAAVKDLVARPGSRIFASSAGREASWFGQPEIFTEIEVHQPAEKSRRGIRLAGSGGRHDLRHTRFFLSSDRGVLVTSPDPLSLNKAYGFLKAAIYRSIARLCAGDTVVYSHLEQMAARAFRPTINQFLSGLKG